MDPWPPPMVVSKGLFKLIFLFNQFNSFIAKKWILQIEKIGMEGVFYLLLDGVIPVVRGGQQTRQSDELGWAGCDITIFDRFQITGKACVRLERVRVVLATIVVLVEKRERHLLFERPRQEQIVIAFHNSEKHRQVTATTDTITSGINT